MSVKCLITMLFLVTCCFVWHGQSLSIRHQKRSGTADQELFHLIEKMKHRPVAGIIDVNRIGKRHDDYATWRLKAMQQQDEESPIEQGGYFD